MTPRRSFIRSLALLSGAAVGCPGIFIPKFEAVRWKVRRGVWMPNHEYIGLYKNLVIENFGYYNPFYHKWTWLNGLGEPVPGSGLKEMPE